MSERTICDHCGRSEPSRHDDVAGWFYLWRKAGADDEKPTDRHYCQLDCLKAGVEQL